MNNFFVVLLAVFIYVFIVTLEISFTDLSCKRLCILRCHSSNLQEEQDLIFEEFDNESGTIDGHYIVPNYVHFVQFGQSRFNFLRTVCILAAFKNQRPEKLFIHTDQDTFQGKYWNVIMNTTGFKESLTIRKMKVPTEIFGQPIQQKWKYYHGGDVARLQILMKYGGIYLDTDSYIVRSLDDFRRFEFTLGWKPGKGMGNQILVANKNARFLHLWYNSYKGNYDNQSWYHNSGHFPTYRFLNHHPNLVHRVEKLFGVYKVIGRIYMTEFPEWRDYYTLHLIQSRISEVAYNGTDKNIKYPLVFSEKNILHYPFALREMCKAVYPLPDRNILKDNINKIPVIYLIHILFS